MSDATDGALADLVIDTTPNATKPVVDALEIVRVGGTVVLAGLKWGREVPGFVSDQLIMKEITMRGVAAASSLSYRKAMQVLASHHHPLHLLHTHSFPLERAADAIMTFARETSDRTAIAVSINP